MDADYALILFPCNYFDKAINFTNGVGFAEGSKRKGALEVTNGSLLALLGSKSDAGNLRTGKDGNGHSIFVNCSFLLAQSMLHGNYSLMGGKVS